MLFHAQLAQKILNVIFCRHPLEPLIIVVLQRLDSFSTKTLNYLQYDIYCPKRNMTIVVIISKYLMQGSQKVLGQNIAGG